VRVATWNVNGLRARQDFLLAWLRAREPDVALLQELKLPDGRFPHDVFAQAGYQALAHGQKSWNGVALLAKKGCRARRSSARAGSRRRSRASSSRASTAPTESTRSTRTSRRSSSGTTRSPRTSPRGTARMPRS
jgi:exonuclease III